MSITTDDVAAATRPSHPAPVHPVRAIGVQTRYQLLQTIRIPIALVGAAFFPAVSMLFFVVPSAGSDPLGATLATASMVVFAAMISNLFGFGIGVAEDRAKSWDPFTRTLPVGALPRFGGRILTGIVMMFLSLLPVVVVAVLLTEATASPLQLLAAMGVLVVVSLPFILMGLAIGYSLPNKAALAVVQIVFMPMAFAGGLLTDPSSAPGFIEVIAPYVPTRGAVELMWAAVSDFQVNPVSVVSLAAWTIVLAGLAVAAFRRDEGVRYR